MKLQSLLQYIGWPTAAGIIIALLALLVFPQLRNQHAPTPVTNSGNYGPVSYADAVSRAAPAVVNIYTEKKVLQRAPSYYNNPYYRHFYNNSNTPLQERMQKTLGSGVIVDTNGLILTNNHVINGANKIQVLLNDGRVTSAELVGIDADNDIAVLRIQLDKLTAISLDQTGNIRVGDVVLAIGNPFGVGQSVSQGIVSATGRWNLGINEFENFIQTDAAINPGNSGGALIDARGNLIGINTAQLDETTATSVGISFAVPAEIAMKSLKQIITYGEVRHIWLGVSADQLSAKGIEKYGTGGMIVTALEAGAPADQAGLQVNDIITHINGNRVSDGHGVKNLLSDIELGSTIKISVLRDGKTLELHAIAKTLLNANTQT